MKAVFTAAGCRIVKRYLQIVFTKKPAEGAPCFVKPELLFSQSVCLQTCGNGCAGFDWLLIEASLLAVLCEKSPRSDRDEDIFFPSVLRRDKPSERLASCFDHSFVLAMPPCC